MSPRFFFRLGPWLSFALALGGCDADSDAVANPRQMGPTMDASDEPPTEAELELLGDTQHRLRFGEEAAVDVRYTMPDGTPIEGGVVSFALVGTASGSSLQALDVVTDDSGMARNVLLAGDQAGSFQVRVAADGADPLFVDVAVSDQGFGALMVMANYVGSRFVERRTVVAQAEISCAEAARRPGDPMQTLTELGPARFVALPAGRTYAISVFAEGPDALPMASGCTDGVLVSADREQSVTVTFTDEPLSFDGRYQTHFALNSAEPARVLADTIRQAGTLLVESDADGNPAPLNAEARLLLDVLDRTLRSEQYAAEVDHLALADALAAERLTPTLVPTLEENLQARLDAGGLGALIALETLAAASEASLATTRLDSVLVLALDGAVLTADWEPSTLTALPIGTAPTAPALDLSSAGAVVMSTKLMLASDRVAVTSASLPLGWGSLGAQSLGVGAGADAGLLTELHEELGCAELGALLESVVWAAGRCDAACIDMVCARSLGTLVAGAEGALLALDSTRPLTVLGGELIMSDRDGDLWAESLSGQLDGSWQDSPSAGDPLTAMGSGLIEMQGTLGAEP